MENHAEFMFHLTIIFLEDENTGTVTAFFAQFPQASAEGRNKEEQDSFYRKYSPLCWKIKRKNL